MEKKIIVCIGTDRASNVRARLSLLVVEKGEQVIAEHFHSVNIADGDPLDAVRASVEAHLAMDESSCGIPLAPWPAIPDEEWRKVEQVCAVMQPSRAALAAADR
jgi:hypothetical protein